MRITILPGLDVRGEYDTEDTSEDFQTEYRLETSVATWYFCSPLWPMRATAKLLPQATDTRFWDTIARKSFREMIVDYVRDRPELAIDYATTVLNHLNTS